MNAKQKIVHGRGPSNINLVIFVCSFDVCRFSKPLTFISQALKEGKMLRCSKLKLFLAFYPSLYNACKDILQNSEKVKKKLQRVTVNRNSFSRVRCEVLFDSESEGHTRACG